MDTEAKKRALYLLAGNSTIRCGRDVTIFCDNSSDADCIFDLLRDQDFIYLMKMMLGFEESKDDLPTLGEMIISILAEQEVKKS